MFKLEPSSLMYAITLSSKPKESNKVFYLVCHGYTYNVMYLKNLNCHVGAIKEIL